MQLWLVVQRLKRLRAMWETWVQSLGQEDPLEKEMAAHSSISCLENPMARGARWATVPVVAKSWMRLSGNISDGRGDGIRQKVHTDYSQDVSGTNT